MVTTAIQQTSVEELSALYDRIYDIADRLFKKHNPCNIHTIKNGISCISRKTGVKHGLCCGGCKYVSEIGCMVKCLPCKLFVCGTIKCIYDKNGRRTRNKKYKHFVDKLFQLQRIAAKHGICIHTYFKTKDEILDISRNRIKEEINYGK